MVLLLILLLLTLVVVILQMIKDVNAKPEGAIKLAPSQWENQARDEGKPLSKVDPFLSFIFRLSSKLYQQT